MDITGFVLYNAETNTAIQTVAEGDTLDFNALQQSEGTTDFTIVCETTAFVESVQFTDSTGTNVTDNDVPYSLAPSTGDNVDATDFLANLGEWTVTCLPFCEDNRGGIAGTPESITFTVAFPTSTPTSAPTSAPSSTPSSPPTQEICESESKYMYPDCGHSVDVLEKHSPHPLCNFDYFNTMQT
jgi:hypothetical protein